MLSVAVADFILPVTDDFLLLQSFLASRVSDKNSS